MNVNRSRRRVEASLLAALLYLLANVPIAAAAVTLPIEVVGDNGTVSSVTVDVASERAAHVRALWVQLHSSSYADMASVQINDSAWFPLNNGTVEVAEPGRSYGGIGGGFSTLKLTMKLAANTIVSGANTIRFRFNHTDGIASGFRVVAFNLLDGDGGNLLGPDTFSHEDPNTWVAPLSDAVSVRTGQELWQGAPLSESALPNAGKIRAHCADCHAADGRDLKYFGFSNRSIVARSRFHGLTELQGQQIASYIRTRPVSSPGRPWNPPYQPGPGLDSGNVVNWAAGAGLSWVLDRDRDTLPYIFGAPADLARRLAGDETGSAADWGALAALIRRSDLRPDGNLNPREIPMALPLPDWNHWLPRVHPMDAWGPAFEKSEFARLYASTDSSQLASLVSSGRLTAYFDKWLAARRAFLRPYVERAPVRWTADLMLKAYSTELWQLVKTWEMTQASGVEGRGRELYGATGEPRTWFNTIPAATAPATVNIPSGPSGMGGSAVTNEYFNASWYALQVLVNSGNHRHDNRSPVDWLYLIGSFDDLYKESRQPEPARLLITVIKALQSTDPGKGPHDVAQGWRPAQTVDPAILVHPAWAPMFEPLPADVKLAILESMLTAWLDKNEQYRVDQYFRVGLSATSYTPPAKYAGLSGGRPWEAAPLLLAAGVDPDLVRRLRTWGASYTETAARFQYAPGGQTRQPSGTKKNGSK